jgi:quinolinate synthase
MKNLTNQIKQLRSAKNAVILAHYYVLPEIQDIADYVGDSYYLSKVAAEVPAEMIVFCGVTFMGESAKILSPEKKVLMPEPSAECPMALMSDIDDIKRMRDRYDDLAVVCYVNSTAEVKALSDVCVTSSNAVKITSMLPQKNIYFIPDENLGRYISGQTSEKNFILNDGFCCVHQGITAEMIGQSRALHPDAEVLIHPECTAEAIALADYVGSTTGIIRRATESDKTEFIVCTEDGVFHQLKKKNPGKVFHTASTAQQCNSMRRLTLEKVLYALQNDYSEVILDAELIAAASIPLNRMLEMAE